MASVFKRKDRKKWVISYVDEDGHRRSVAGSASKAVTQQIANEIQAKVELRKHGIIDAAAERQSSADRKLLAEHLDDFHKALLAKGNTRHHADTQRNRVDRIIAACGAQRISELTPSAVQAAVSELHRVERDPKKDRKKALSLQSRNHYLRAVKTFSKWLWRDRRAREDLLGYLVGYNAKTDPKHQRRAITEEQLDRLIETAERGPEVLGVEGSDRAMLYRLAVNTGFRANELRSLTPEAFDLDAEPATVIVEAGYAKNGQEAEQALRRDFAEMLRPWLAGKEPGRPVVHVPERTARMLRVDLAEAEIPYRDGAEQVFDFHALRHQAGTMLKDARVHPKAIQSFMRHSTITLTMDRYSHPSVQDQRDVLDALPALSPGSKNRDKKKATGTAG